MKQIQFTILAGEFLLLALACAGSDDQPDSGQGIDVGNTSDQADGESDGGCHLGCDGNIDDSVFITIVDDLTGVELCCPTTLRINGNSISDGGVEPEGCECTWEEAGREAFIVATEGVLTLIANTLFEIEVEGYQPWQTEEYVPCVCVPRVEFTARLTPE